MISAMNLDEDKKVLTFVMDEKEYTVKIDGTIDDLYFYAKDVREILEFGGDTVNAKYCKKIDNGDMYISEAGLYIMITRSKSPFSKACQDFLFEELLPSIRKEMFKELKI